MERGNGRFNKVAQDLGNAKVWKCEKGKGKETQMEWNGERKWRNSGRNGNKTVDRTRHGGNKITGKIIKTKEDHKKTSNLGFL